MSNTPASSTLLDIANSIKEYVAATLALAIVGFMIYTMHVMFTADPKVTNEQWQHMSSILQVAVGLAGTVTGYYFGRIPAEKAATTAQQATANEARIRGQVEQLRKQFATPIGGTPTGGAGAQNMEGLRQQIVDQLAQIG